MCVRKTKWVTEYHLALLILDILVFLLQLPFFVFLCESTVILFIYSSLWDLKYVIFFFFCISHVPVSLTEEIRISSCEQEYQSIPGPEMSSLTPQIAIQNGNRNCAQSYTPTGSFFKFIFFLFAYFNA